MRCLIQTNNGFSTPTMKDRKPKQATKMPNKKSSKDKGSSPKSIKSATALISCRKLIIRDSQGVSKKANFRVKYSRRLLAQRRTMSPQALDRVVIA